MATNKAWKELPPERKFQQHQQIHQIGTEKENEKKSKKQTIEPTYVLTCNFQNGMYICELKAHKWTILTLYTHTHKIPLSMLMLFFLFFLFTSSLFGIFLLFYFSSSRFSYALTLRMGWCVCMFVRFFWFINNVSVFCSEDSIKHHVYCMFYHQTYHIIHLCATHFRTAYTQPTVFTDTKFKTAVRSSRLLSFVCYVHVCVCARKGACEKWLRLSFRSTCILQGIPFHSIFITFNSTQRWQRQRQQHHHHTRHRILTCILFHAREHTHTEMWNEKETEREWKRHTHIEHQFSSFSRLLPISISIDAFAVNFYTRLFFFSCPVFYCVCL